MPTEGDRQMHRFQVGAESEFPTPRIAGAGAAQAGRKAGRKVVPAQPDSLDLTGGDIRAQGSRQAIRLAGDGKVAILDGAMSIAVGRNANVNPHRLAAASVDEGILQEVLARSQPNAAGQKRVMRSEGGPTLRLIPRDPRVAPSVDRHHAEIVAQAMGIAIARAYRAGRELRFERAASRPH